MYYTTTNQLPAGQANKPISLSIIITKKPVLLAADDDLTGEQTSAQNGFLTPRLSIMAVQKQNKLTLHSLNSVVELRNERG